MSKSVHPPSPSEYSEPDQELRLRSLAPRFKQQQHGVYYKLLLRALDDERHRNIALTGAYGTGKSSVLQQLAEDRESAVVVLSLSTIAPEVHDKGVPERNGFAADSSRTMEIQKEIVKQLLYRLKPSAVPQSRFRRPDLPDERLNLIIAGIAAISVFSLAMALAFDLVHPHLQALFPGLWRQITVYAVAFALCGLVAWVLVRLVRLRPRVNASVQSGIATVTLSNSEDSYFDAYLDEIVYFFQASHASIVVIEDIDRFEDVQVFDTLRALNGLLNGSQQVGRRIVFVYAIRDSVFELIDNGAPPAIDERGNEALDRAQNALKRANRTKFFDIIIPIVPFVSADNARDLMSKAMKSDEFKINPALIRLAARHVADMRLIHNIRNEFEVYRYRLIVSDRRVPGITDDMVFAIILYKNTHLADFESIRHRNSQLDQLYAFWRELVRHELKSHSETISDLRRAHRLEDTARSRANQLGQSLARLRDTLQESLTEGSATVALAGPATDDNLNAPDTWKQIAEGSEQQFVVSGGSGRYTTKVTLSFTTEQLAELLGVTIDPADWETNGRLAHEETIADETARINFLRHHTWEQIARRDDFAIDPGELKLALTTPSGEELAGNITFAKAIETLLESDLARDLVRNGYLTAHFAVYSASYYGKHLGPDAREYIWRCIEPGVPDGSFPISRKETRQLLREQNADKNDEADLFSDASIFNVSIVDYLFSARPAAAATVARRLTELGDQEHEFLALYLTEGEAPGALLAAMTPDWAGIIRYVAVDASVPDELRTQLLDNVLRSLTHAQYDSDGEIKTMLEQKYTSLTAICAPASLDAAVTVLNVLRAAGGRVPSLVPLNTYARQTAVSLRLYPLTVENYRIIVQSQTIALDTLKEVPDAYSYTLDHLDEFLTLVEKDSESIKAIANPVAFAAVINDVHDHASPPQLSRLIRATDEAYRIEELDQVPDTAWPVLVEQSRTSPTFKNVAAYVGAFGVDAALGEMLRKKRSITPWTGVAQQERRAVALAVLNAPDSIASAYIRAGIAKKLSPGVLSAEELTPESGNFMATLLKRRLVADDSTAFSKDLMIDWKTLEATILASKKFASFVSPQILDIADVTRLVRVPSISEDIIRAILSNLNEYLAGASRTQVRTLTDSFIDRGWRLAHSRLVTLAGAGAAPSQIISLIKHRGDALSNKDIISLLVMLGGPYAQVAAGGTKRPHFPNNPSHEYTLNRLVGTTIRRVEPRVTKRWGNRLVARLM